MKLSEAVKLGHQNISGYKRRSFSAILTAGIMFGVLLGVIMVVQGLENALLRANDASFSSSPYYLLASTNFLQCESETIFDQDGKFAGIDTTCPEFDNDLLKSDVAKFHGEVLDNLSTEERLKLITGIIKTPIDLENIPEGAVPILVSVASALNYAGLYPPQHLNIADQLVIALQVAQPLIGQVVEHDGTKFYYAGLLPTGQLSIIGSEYYRGHWQESHNPLDFVLEIVGARGTPDLASEMLILNDGSLAVLNYITMVGSFSPGSASDMENYVSHIVKFDNFPDAYDFIKTHNNFDGSTVKPEDAYIAQDYFGNRIQIVHGFRLIDFILDIIKYITMVIALIIMLITCIKVINSESENIHLYRSLGASTSNLWKIYGAYLLEFCLLTIGFALLVGAIIAGITSILNATALAQMLEIAYAQPITFPIILLGLNWSIFQIILAMLLIAPVVLLLCHKKFRN